MDVDVKRFPDLKWIEYDDPEKKKRELEEIIRKNPEHANAHYELATVYAFLSDFPKAREYCERALDLSHQNIPFWTFFTYVCANNGDEQDAMEALAKLIELGAEKDEYVELAILTVAWEVEKEFFWHQFYELQNSGKEKIANTLKEWIIGE